MSPASSPSAAGKQHRRAGVLRTALVVLTASLVPLVAGAPARAEVLVDPDPVGDLVRWAQDEPVVAPDRVYNDVTRTRIRHGEHRIAVRVSFVDLALPEGIESLKLVMLTDQGLRRTLWVEFKRHASATFYRHHEPDPSCPVRASVDTALDQVKVSFSRRCLDHPRWIQVKLLSLMEMSDTYYDDAMSDRPMTSTRLVWSPRVHPG